VYDDLLKDDYKAILEIFLWTNFIYILG